MQIGQFFQSLFKNSQSKSGDGAMSLEERKAFRQELLYKSIRETFSTLGMVGRKVRAMPVDERHHRYVVMVDMDESYLARFGPVREAQKHVQDILRKQTFSRYAVLIEGVYWKLQEAAPQPKAQEQAELEMQRTMPLIISGVHIQPLPRSAPPVQAPRPAAVRHEVSEDEIRAFMSALQQSPQGKTPPPVQVGGREYHSDVAPLDALEDGIHIGGTFFGKL